MASIAIGFGLALIVLGIAGFLLTGAEHYTALIPVFFGIILAYLGNAARNPERRKMSMHIAVAVALLGFVGSARGLGKISALLSGGPVERPAAVIAQSMMAVLMLIFVVLGVLSFINARRSRSEEVLR